MTDKLYVVNNLDQALDLKSGYLIIEAGGYAPINPVDKDEATVVWAIGRGWATITDKEPTGKAAKPAAVAVEVTKPYEGMTAEELKAEQAKEADEPKKDAATGSALGEGSTVEMTGEQVQEEVKAAKAKKAKGE